MDSHEVMILVAAAGLVLFLLFIVARMFAAPKPFLDKTRKKAMIMDVTELSHDTKRFRLSLGGKNVPLGLPLAKHIRLFAPNPESCLAKGTWNGQPDADKGSREIQRSYTPTPSTVICGYVDVVAKMYRPGSVLMPDGKEVVWEDGGKMSSYLDSKSAGDYIEISGPTGLHEYLGNGVFKMPGKTVSASHFGLLAGGTGITPMLQLIHAALRDPNDKTKFTLIYANKHEDDILVRDLLEKEAQSSNGQFTLHYTLDFPPDSWSQFRGFITAEMIKKCFPAPEQKPIILMCGPPAMIEFACKKNLDILGYPKDLMAAF